MEAEAIRLFKTKSIAAQARRRYSNGLSASLDRVSVFGAGKAIKFGGKSRISTTEAQTSALHIYETPAEWKSVTEHKPPDKARIELACALFLIERVPKKRTYGS